MSEDDHQKFLTFTRKRYSANLGDPIESGKPKDFGKTTTRALLLHVKPYSFWLWVYAHPGKPGLSSSQADRLLTEIAKELTKRVPSK